MRANILSIDVEDWFHLNYDSMDDAELPKGEARVEHNTERLLELLARRSSKATFFFLGSVAESHPGLVRRAKAEGHEIASHGYAHQLVYSQSREDFEEDVRKSKRIIEDITGESLRGYRAPSWSINAKTPWFYEVLEGLGFEYSASLFPFTTYLYGDSSAPVRWFRPEAGEKGIVEVPTTVWQCGPQRVPFSGGFYLRFLPYWAIRFASKRVNKRGLPVIYYLHPREIDPAQPRIELPRKDRFITYYGIRSCERKMDKLLSHNRCITLANYLEDEGALGVPAKA